MHYIKICLLTACTMLSFICKGQCDSQLIVSSDDLTKYKNRGNRCEGEYVRKVAAPEGLEVVSFTRGGIAYSLTPQEVIKVSVIDKQEDIVNIRAVAIPLNKHYQMDARLKSSETLTWNVRDVLHKIQLQQDKLGVYGWTGTQNNKTYFIVELKTSLLVNENSMRLLMRTYSNVRDVKWRYAKIEADAVSGFSELYNLRNQMNADSSAPIILPPTLLGNYLIEIRAKEAVTEGDIIKQIRICTTR